MPAPARWWPGRAWMFAMVAAGVASPVAYPPIDLWPLIFFTQIPMIAAGWRLPPRQATMAGMAYGASLAITGFYWLTVMMTEYGGMSWPLACSVLALVGAYGSLYFGSFTWLLCRWGPTRPSSLLLGPLFWVGLEWLRGEAFTGFPWMPLGQALVPAPPLLQTAEWWGVTGLSAMITLVAMLLAWALVPLAKPRRPWSRLLAGGLALALVAAGWLWGQARMAQVQRTAAQAPHMQVSVVQGNFPLRMLWDRSRRLEIIERQVRLTREAGRDVQGRPWLVVWSESSAPFYFLLQSEPSKPALDLTRDQQLYLTLGTHGMLVEGDTRRTTNRAYLIGPGAELLGFYDKVHLVPFGEYVPWSKVLFFVRALATIGYDFAAGQEMVNLPAGPARLGPLICYESIFPELARQQRLKGANLLVNQTNDSWYGRTTAPVQHMSHLVLRAVENRLACARSANTGVSGFIMPDGTIVGATDIFVQAQRTARLPLMDLETFFTRHGDLMGPGGLAVSLAVGLWILWRRRRGREDKDVRGA